MKKFLALFLSLVLLFTSVPCGASATEAERTGYNTLVSKAVAAFPEYADKLLNPRYDSSTYTRDATARVLVANETRSISDKEGISYAEYSDGLILLSDYHFTSDSSLVNSLSGTTYRDITINISAACVTDFNYDGYFYLDGVSYTLRTGVNVFDRITNPGTPRKGTNCTNYSREEYTENETYFGDARLAYRLTFKVGPQAYQVVQSILSLQVGGDTAILNNVDWN